MEKLTPAFLSLLLCAGCQLAEGVQFENGVSRLAVATSIGSVSTDVEYPSGSGLPDEDQDLDQFAVGFSYGRFVSETVEVGGEFGYSNTESSVSITGASGSVTDKQVSGLGFARIYSSPTGSTRFFGEAALGLAAADREFDNGISTVGFGFDGFAYSVSGGVAAFIAEGASLDAKLQY